MATAPPGPANRRLHYAALQLRLAGGEPAGPQQEALLQSALWHLLSGYRLYLKEITATFQLDIVATDAGDAAHQLQSERSRSSGELAELQELERDANSWLALAMTAEAQLDSEPAQANAGLIAVQTDKKALSAENCAHWLRELKAIIGQQRERLQEW